MDILENHKILVIGWPVRPAQSWTKNNTYVDGYEIYKKGIIGRKKIGTIYISGDGSSNATKAPKGFKFI